MNGAAQSRCRRRHAEPRAMIDVAPLATVPKKTYPRSRSSVILGYRPGSAERASQAVFLLNSDRSSSFASFKTFLWLASRSFPARLM